MTWKRVGAGVPDQLGKLFDLVKILDLLPLDVYGGRPPLRDDRMDVLKEFR